MLEEYEFSKDSPFYDQLVSFKEKMLEYFEATWVSGSFPPLMWCHNNRSARITNNFAEAFNSRCHSTLSLGT